MPRSRVHVFEAKLWSHASITRHRKIEIYSAMVRSKVLHSLESLWILKADMKRLDAFHARCLRKILRIPSSYISRISNSEVLTIAGQTLLSESLRQRQVQLYTKIWKEAGDGTQNSLIQKLVCNKSGEPVSWNLNRGRGRPRQQWNQSVYKLLQKPEE